MKPKHKRMLLLALLVALVAGAVALVLLGLRESVTYFYSPSEVRAGSMEPGTPFRLGGLVLENSVLRPDDGKDVHFIVTDGAGRVTVYFDGLLPPLFNEGQGVVVEGALNRDGIFIATRVLAKHDENYMPPEVADALKRAGRWQEDRGQEGGGQEGASQE